MAKRIRGKTQAQKERAALEKLKATGLYKGKIDKRRKPTPAQKRLLTQYKDILAGKATVVRPKDPASYKGLFRVKGDKVIVPRRKGEKIKINKAGNIEGERRVGSRTVKTKFRRIKSDKDLPENKILAVPFIRGRKPNGDPILEWKRFPNKAALMAIMGGYETRQKNPYVNWQDYVIEESVGASDRTLFKKLGSKRKHIRFDDDEENEE